MARYLSSAVRTKYAMVIGLLLGVALIPAVFVGAWTWALVFLTIAESGVMFSNGAAVLALVLAGVFAVIGAVFYFILLPASKTAEIFGIRSDREIRA